MFHWLSDPGADGVGVAFTSAAVNLGDLQDPDARAVAFGGVSDALGVDIAFVHQVHGRRVLAVPAGPASRLRDLTGEDADALVTDVPGVALAVRAADCLPIVFADPAARVVGAAHAGRLGLLAGVLEATVTALRDRGASRVRAWIGPHVCGPCYEVPDDMASDFAAATGVAAVPTPRGTLGIDLGAAARRQLDALGVQYESHEQCTLTEPSLHSHRRDAAAAGRQAGLVWLV